MIKNLDEAIEHCVEKSKECTDCGKEHLQLMEWLIELKNFKEQVGNVDICKDDDTDKDCIVLQMDDADHFRECINAYMKEGYNISSTGCSYSQWKAILIK